MTGFVRVAVAILQGVLLVAWPLLVFFGGERFGTRGVALLLLALALPALVRAVAAGRRAARTLLGSSGGVVAILALSALLDHPALLLAYPALVNLVLLVQFGSSLRGTPFVERFARLVDPELSEPEVRYCRTVTRVWCAFFALNGVAAALLAAFAPRAWWAAYTGLLSYLLVGALFAAEWLVRKVRFRRFGPGLLDRALEPLLRSRSHG